MLRLRSGAVPELVEVEMYRRAAVAVIGRTISGVDAPDAWFCKRDTTPDRLRAELPGTTVFRTRRHGKLLLLDLTGGSVLGLRFGMTGRLLVNGRGPIDKLLSSGQRDDPAWDRFAILFTDGSRLALRDPRRLGGVEIDPDTSELGVDATTLTLPTLRASLHGTRGPVKAALLDQSRIAGVGNLIADEVLWRTGIAPDRLATDLGPIGTQALAAAIPRTIDVLLRRGGSHLGDHVAHRTPGACCPRDGAPMLRTTIGGRTTWSCSHHQR